MNKQKLKTYVELALMLIVLLGTFQLFTKFGFIGDLKPDTTYEKTIMWLGLIIITFVTLGVHELGHLLTGLAQGFAFQLFVVGPLGIKREDDKIKVYFNKELGHYGGVAATSPVEDSPDNARKFANLILGGPIASLLFVALFLFIAWLIGKPFGIVFYMGGIMSIAIFFATTIPSKTGMFFTDRKRYQRLTTPGKDQEVELAMLRIMGRFSQDNSYKNVDKKDMEELTTDDFPFIQFYGWFNLLCYQMEVEGEISSTTQEQYDECAKEMPKNLVIAFNKELEKYQQKLAAEV